MNTKHIFNDKDWIVTSGESVVTPLHGTRPMHPALSKKLYDQNAMKYTRKNSISGYNTLYFNLTCRSPPHADISTSITTINKYTIVELTHNNKHYHGLASRADCDKENAVTGIAVAYHRAFEKMMDGFKIGVATYDENSPKMQGSSPSTVVLDDDLSPIGKAYFKNKDWVSYDLPLKKLKDTPGFKKFEASTYRKRIDNQLKDTVDKQSKLVDKAISDLLACTYIDLKQYDLKTVHGAKAAIKEISKYGYNIYELHNIDPLILTYVLQRCGVEITRRDIKLTLPDLKLHPQSIAKKPGIVFHIKSGKKVTK